VRKSRRPPGAQTECPPKILKSETQPKKTNKSQWCAKMAKITRDKARKAWPQKKGTEIGERGNGDRSQAHSRRGGRDTNPVRTKKVTPQTPGTNYRVEDGGATRTTSNIETFVHTMTQAATKLECETVGKNLDHKKEKPWKLCCGDVKREPRGRTSN